MSRDKDHSMITDLNQACFVKMIGRRVQEVSSGQDFPGKEGASLSFLSRITQWIPTWAGGQWILFGWLGQGVSLPAGGRKNPFCRLVRMKLLSWVTLILPRKLFVPVSPAWFEKAPHIL